MKDDNYLTGAVRHLLQRPVEVNREILMVYKKRRLNYRSHDCFLCVSFDAVIPPLSPPSLLLPPLPPPPPVRLFLLVSPVTSRPSLQHQHRG